MGSNTVISRLFLNLRKKHGWNQRKMATVLGVNQSTVSRIEKAEFMPDVYLIKRIEALENTPFEKLLEDTVNIKS